MYLARGTFSDLFQLGVLWAVPRFLIYLRISTY